MLPELRIKTDVSIKEALKALDRGAEQILFVVDDNQRLVGTLTDGDIRRVVINGASLEGPIKGVFNTKPIVLKKGDYSASEALKLMHKHKIERIPIIDGEGVLIDYVSWDIISSPGANKIIRHGAIDIPVVIMAGGKGTRLSPFTNVLPKPLVPIGDKTVLEMVIDQFRTFGIDHFFLTVNYKGEMIRAYFNGLEKEYKVSYVWEEEFLGTASSICLMKESLPDSFIVSNCDILVKADYEDVIKFHKQSEAMLTIISSIQHYIIPYGVIQITSGGQVEKIEEKPEYTLPINTGVYVLNRECLNYIPEKTLFHMTHLIQALLDSQQKVVTYPVNEREYVDIGQWEEYRKAVLSLKVV